MPRDAPTSPPPSRSGDAPTSPCKPSLWRWPHRQRYPRRAVPLIGLAAWQRALEVTNLLRPNPGNRCWATRKRAPWRHGQPCVKRKRDSPAQGVPVTVQPVPKTWAARIPREGNEPGSRKVDRVVLGGASRRDRWIAKTSTRTRLGVRLGDIHSHGWGISPRRPQLEALP